MKTPLLTHLDDDDALARRTRRPIVLACMLASSILAPLVDELILGGFFSEGYALALHELVLYAGWAALLSAVIAGVVVHLSLADRHVIGPFADTLGLSALGGTIQCGLVLVAPALVRTLSAGPLAHEALAMPVMGGVMGAIVAAPMGLAFGGVFLVAVRPAQKLLAAPTHTGPTEAWRHAAFVLAIASVLAGVLAYVLEGTYCQSLFLVIAPALDVHVPTGSDLAWTRLVIVPAPLVLGALASFAWGTWLARRMKHTLTALRAGEHPGWVIAPIAQTSSPLLPLRDDDRASSFAVHARDESAPYRAAPAALALVSRDA
jgi:hypothetical protein